MHPTLFSVELCRCGFHIRQRDRARKKELSSNDLSRTTGESCDQFLAARRGESRRDIFTTDGRPTPAGSSTGERTVSSICGDILLP
jgi:hypothetical protein